MRLARLLLLASLVLVPSAALPQDPTPRRATITVTGFGEAELPPDLGRLVVLVRTSADTMQQAVDSNRASMERVLSRLQQTGVKREDMRTLNLQTYPTPPRRGDDGREIKTPRFTASHQLRVTTRDIEGVGRLAGEVASVESVSLQSLTFGLDHKDAGADIARRAAVEDARRQAELYAEAAGVRLGRIVEIRDGTAQPLGVQEDSSMAMAARAEPVPVVPPATLRYTATVQMIWDIAP